MPPPGTCHLGSVAGQPMPDERCTPGSTNAAVAQGTIHETICKSGWTATVRPPVGVTDAIKAHSARAYSIPVGSVGELALSPSEASQIVRNLWPENWDGPEGAHVKDVLEEKALSMVCNGTIPLKDAQQAIVTDWVAAYRRYVGPI